MAEPNDKAALRRHALHRRQSAADRAGHVAVVEALIAALPADGAVAGYWPMRGEIDPRPAMAALHALGRPLGLPVVIGRDVPLMFRRHRPGDALLPGRFGVMEPDDPETIVPLGVIVPLLAFDRRGWRLGYGGGFYDRTLARLRAAGPVRAVGLAYAGQEVEAVPHGPHDERLDLIVTEAGVIAPEGGTCD